MTGSWLRRLRGGSGLVLLAAAAAHAKDPCPPTPPEDIRACEELAKHVRLPLLPGTGAVGMDDAFLYAFEPDGTPEKSTRLVKRPLAGGAPVVLASEVGTAEPEADFGSTPLIVASTQLYWSTLEGVFTVPKAGGEIVPFSPSGAFEEKTFGLISDGQRLYWQNSNGDLWMRPLRSGKPRKLLHRKEGFDHLTSAGAFLVWLEGQGGARRLFILNPQTHALRSLRVPEKDEVFDLAASARFVYLGTLHGVQRVAVTGKVWKTVSPRNAEHLILGEAHLFFTPWKGNCGGGHLLEVPLDGGPERELTKCESPRNWMVHDHQLYFVDPGGLGAFSETGRE